MELRQIFIYALYFSAVKGAIKFDLLLAVLFCVHFNNKFKQVFEDLSSLYFSIETAIPIYVILRGDRSLALK